MRAGADQEGGGSSPPLPPQSSRALAVSAGAPAQALPNQVTGLTAVQHDGYATLAWGPVAGATDYQIERTPVDAADVPTGAAVDHRPLAAAAHDHAGRAEIRRRRLRARRPLPVAGAREIRNDDAQPYSEPVFGTTLPQWGTGPARCGRNGRRAATRRIRATSTSTRTKPRSSRRAHASAWSSSAARTRSRAVRPRRGTDRSTCSSSATRHRRRRRRRSRIARRSPTTATSTATSRRDASRA